MLEISRRHTLAWLNNRYIYGRVPLLHTIVFLIELIMVIRLATKHTSYMDKRPVLTTMIVNAILAGIADTVAQSITAFQARRLTLPTTADSRSFISSGVELEDLNEKPARIAPRLSPTSTGPPPFDFERLTRFMAYGFLIAPVQFMWFKKLGHWFPGKGTVSTLQKVAMDQFLFSPVGIACFFSFMTIAEGGGKKQVVKKFQDVYIPTLRANYILWPAVQIINFRVMPHELQVPFVSTIGIAWTAYLSLTNSSEEASTE